HRNHRTQMERRQSRDLQVHQLRHHQPQPIRSTRLSLASNINQLINTHIAYSPAGKIIKQPALLTQLTDFIGATGNSGSSEPPIPGSIKALSTHVQMQWDAKNHQYKMTGDDTGGIWEILQAWENVVANTGNEWEASLEQ